MINIRVRANLLDKEVEIDGIKLPVYGLTDFYTKPNRRGIGIHCIKAFEDIAIKDNKYCIVGFCDDDETLKFYIKAGWYFQYKYKEKNLFTSIPVKSILVSESW